MSTEETAVPERDPIVGTSFDSFAEAARSAFDQVPGDPKREGTAAASVTKLWMTKGGIVGRVQFHAEIDQIGDEQ